MERLLAETERVVARAVVPFAAVQLGLAASPERSGIIKAGVQTPVQMSRQSSLTLNSPEEGATPGLRSADGQGFMMPPSRGSSGAGNLRDVTAPRADALGFMMSPHSGLGGAGHSHDGGVERRHAELS
jgi:hypothetical protein